jgi:uncharacterized protein (TIGR02594 family)
MRDLLIEILSRYGMSEVAGAQSNPEIIAMGKDLGFDIVDDSETAWCSLALNYFAKKCGYEYSNSLAARSWLKMPNQIVVLNPEIGDVVVLWRESPDSWKGHIGLFISQDVHSVYVLGGNQGDKISIMPYNRDRVLGYRKLRKKI